MVRAKRQMSGQVSALQGLLSRVKYLPLHLTPLPPFLCLDSLHSVFMDTERHTSEPGMAASGVNSLKTFHAGNVLALACLQPMSAENGEDSDGVLITGGGEHNIQPESLDAGAFIEGFGVSIA